VDPQILFVLGDVLGGRILGLLGAVGIRVVKERRGEEGGSEREEWPVDHDNNDSHE
jgi:hypothetical protein